MNKLPSATIEERIVPPGSASRDSGAAPHLETGRLDEGTVDWSTLGRVSFIRFLDALASLAGSLTHSSKLEVGNFACLTVLGPAFSYSIQWEYLSGQVTLVCLVSGHHDLSDHTGLSGLSGHPGGSDHPSLSGHPVCLVTPVSLVTPLLSRVIATRDSCAGPFFVVQKYRFLDLWTDFQSCNIKFIMLYSLGKSRTTRKKE